MVKCDRVLLLSIPQLCASLFRIAYSRLGIILSFAGPLVGRKAVDGGNACVVEPVQARGAFGANSWSEVVERYERVPDADVLPGPSANFP